MFKKLFGGSTPERESAGLTLEDLIILERYDEAEAQLKAKLKATPGDRHARLKLAEVYIASKQAGKAVDEYVVVATEYSQDASTTRPWPCSPKPSASTPWTRL